MAKKMPADASVDVEEQSLTELRALLKVPGSLKIITNIPHPDGGDPTAPSSWVQHDVDRIEGPDDRGRVSAYSVRYNAADHGYNDRETEDMCRGMPSALLSRLREHRG